MTSAARLALVRSLAFVLIVVAVGCGDGGGDASPSRTPTPAATSTVRPGTLDASFGSGGVAIADFDGRNDTARAIAVQPDGRVVVAGGSLLPDGESAFALVRRLPDGTPDASFGEGGRVLTPPGGHAFTEATAVAVAGDGHIVLAGQRLDEGPNDQSTWQLVRYTASGVLEPTSGVDLNVIIT